jgi:hypothetical protein
MGRWQQRRRPPDSSHVVSSTESFEPPTLSNPNKNPTLTRVLVCCLQAMAELLDPDGRYFGGRIIAQGVPEVGEDGAPQPLVFKRLLQVRDCSCCTNAQ